MLADRGTFQCLRTWDARAPEHVFTDGITKPILFRCVALDDPTSSARIVTKHLASVLGGSDRDLFAETAGALIARAMGVEAPEPCLVSVSQDMACLARRFCVKHERPPVPPGLAVGSHYLEGLSPLPPRSTKQDLGNALRDAVAIFAFDVLFLNGDRTKGKPNCGLLNGRIVAFDFGLSLRMLDQQSTSAELQQARLDAGRKNLLQGALRNARSGCDWDPVVGAIMSLDTTSLGHVLAAAVGSTPKRVEATCAHITDMQTHAKSLPSWLEAAVRC
ncbi:MAG TPA: hypothetical protein VLH79_11020 [Chthonomonadales bacterium]|nr:hypothetical protein [Chthonomonadales bacterium]